MKNRKQTNLQNVGILRKFTAPCHGALGLHRINLKVASGTFRTFLITVDSNLNFSFAQMVMGDNLSLQNDSSTRVTV